MSTAPPPWLTLVLLFTLLLPIRDTHGGQSEWRSAPEGSGHWRLEAQPPIPDGWTSVDGVYATVSGDAADFRAMQRVARHVEEAIPRIADALGLPAGQRMDIYLVHTTEQFQELQPGAPPSWADATAWPRYGMVFLRSPRLRPGTAEPLEQVLDHEITHVVVGQAFGKRSVPQWLHEGLAQYMAREYTPDLTRRIARGMLGGSLLDLREITSGFPQDPLRAQLAYAQSADLIAYIHNTWGPESLKALVHHMVAGAPVAAAFRYATGESMDDVDEAWRKRLKSSHLWIAPLVTDSMWWGVGAMLIIMGWFMVKRRNRRRLAIWEREEAIWEQLEQLTAMMSSAAPHTWNNDTGSWEPDEQPPAEPESAAPERLLH